MGVRSVFNEIMPVKSLSNILIRMNVTPVFVAMLTFKSYDALVPVPLYLSEV